MLFKIAAGGVASIVTLIPMPEMQCAPAPDNPPSISGSAIFREDVMPEGVRWGVWGEEGYVEGEIGCQAGNGWGDITVQGSGPVYFGGGGSSYSAAMDLTVQCGWLKPYIVRGTQSAWAWD